MPTIILRVQHQGLDPNDTTSECLGRYRPKDIIFAGTRNFVAAALGKLADCKQGLISSTRDVKIREGQVNGTQYATWITFFKEVSSKK